MRTARSSTSGGTRFDISSCNPFKFVQLLGAVQIQGDSGRTRKNPQKRVFSESAQHHLLLRILRIPNIATKLAMKIIAHSPRVGMGLGVDGVLYMSHVLDKLTEVEFGKNILVRTPVVPGIGIVVFDCSKSRKRV
jgi:hypothetical protein